MSRTLFGTDGIRGVVNQYPITPDVILKFGMAAGVYFSVDEHRKKVLIGKDTRLSGYLIEAALTAGLLSVGVDVILVGPMPTPAVAMLIKSLRADCGIIISASHNPYYDNGLKLFNGQGRKLSDNCESNIQDLILSSELNRYLAAPEKLGRATRLDDALGRYIEYVKNSFLKNQSLSGMRIVVDCAHGSAYKLAPTILWELGAEVITVGCDPSGFNINDNCGSTNPAIIAQKVLEIRADIGIALDGDADRVVICDEKGEIIAGDHLIAAVALYLKEINALRGGVVVTQMSNTALDQFLKQNDIKTYRSKVGDRYVASAMKEQGCNFGGEESGHIILSDYSTTGDGLIAALQVLSLLILQQKKASDINKLFTLKPRISKSFPFQGANPLDNIALVDAMHKIKAQYPDIIILVRKSGTEKSIRMMVEGADLALLHQIAIQIELLITDYDAE